MSIGIWQILIIVVLVLLLFGAGRLPRIMEDLAQGIKSFKKGMNEDDQPKNKKEEPPKRLTADEKTTSSSTARDEAKDR
jgi:sec-independent protein translocase protein TatA